MFEMRENIAWRNKNNELAMEVEALRKELAEAEKDDTNK